MWGETSLSTFEDGAKAGGWQCRIQTTASIHTSVGIHTSIGLHTSIGIHTFRCSYLASTAQKGIQQMAQTSVRNTHTHAPCILTQHRGQITKTLFHSYSFLFLVSSSIFPSLPLAFHESRAMIKVIHHTRRHTHTHTHTRVGTVPWHFPMTEAKSSLADLQAEREREEERESESAWERKNERMSKQTDTDRKRINRSGV